MITEAQAVTATVVVSVAAVATTVASIWQALANDRPPQPGVDVPHIGATMEYADELQEWVGSLDPVTDFAPPGSPQLFRSPTARGYAAVQPPPICPPSGRHRAPVDELAQLDNTGIPAHLRSYRAFLDWRRVTRQTAAGTGASR